MACSSPFSSSLSQYLAGHWPSCALLRSWGLPLSTVQDHRVLPVCVFCLLYKDALPWLQLTPSGGLLPEFPGLWVTLLARQRVRQMFCLLQKGIHTQLVQK